MIAMEISVLGGDAEIGGNKILVDSGKTRIFLDFGQSFKHLDDYFVQFSYLFPRARFGLKDYFEFGLMPKLEGLYGEQHLRSTDMKFMPPKYDAVFISHAHFDHNAVHRVPGRPAVLEAPGEHDVRGVRVRGVSSYHDESKGAERGPNVLYIYALEGLALAHLGDLGEPLDAVQLAALADVEVLLVPVGGHFTIDARRAAALVGDLPNVKLVIPMHFKTDVIADWPIDTVEPFAQMMDNVRRIGASTVEVTRQSLPARQEVWILDHA